MKASRELWLQNNGAKDVSLSDLGVKVPMGKTINVYDWNPYLTEDQVLRSKVAGSLSIKLTSKILKIVNTAISNRPVLVDKKQASKKPMMARKTKTSIVIEPETELEAGKEGFEFADYMIGDITSIERNKNSLSVAVKQDQEQKQEIIKSEPFQKAAINPMGPIVETNSPTRTFVAVKPEKKQKIKAPDVPVFTVPPAAEKLPEVKEEVVNTVTRKEGNTIVIEKEARNVTGEIFPNITTSELPPKQEITKNAQGAILMGEVKETRSLRAIAKGTEGGDQIKDDDQTGADKAIKMEPQEGMRVATKTAEGGVIVMELKEPVKEKKVKKSKK